MAGLERGARLLWAALVRRAARRGLPWLLILLLLLGSAARALGLPPPSYLSLKSNLLNVYFVKLAWAWTFWLLLPFIGVTNYCLTRNVQDVLRRLSTLLVGTAVWYICTQFFMYVENLTGSCYKSSALDVLHREHQNKHHCHQAGGFWHGFDISGHSFLLTYCALMIVEEMAVLEVLNTDRSSRLHGVVNALFVALSFLVAIWVLMFLSTAVYFHDFSHKLLGTLVGLSAWYGTYRFWYLKPVSPGLPPQNTCLSSKKSSYSR
ncbi:acyl-coenzyme A diphosphatase FITM2 [Alligator mississippiensis]|uniref:acyl-coenzyme A diphosphatase FITM2 n=1 Tax=Alligator mississippiensis TaxID=8496 RepID=UPI0003D0D5D8|nr:acyl-coenzyme A diphosphatase FITM2 [Alligator mississippiensis]